MYLFYIKRNHVRITLLNKFPLKPSNMSVSLICIFKIVIISTLIIISTLTDQTPEEMKNEKEQKKIMLIRKVGSYFK